MILSGGSATGTASAVWTNPSRTLTGLGGGALSFPAATFTTIPPNGTATIRPAATAGFLITVAVTAAVAGGLNMRLSDGTNSIQIQFVSSGTSFSMNLVVNNTCFLTLQNMDAVNTAEYMFAAIQLHQ
jgi:hypothetical protein